MMAKDEKVLTLHEVVRVRAGEVSTDPMVQRIQRVLAVAGESPTTDEALSVLMNAIGRLVVDHGISIESVQEAIANHVAANRGALLRQHRPASA